MIAIAVCLLKHQNPKTIQTLKDLLTFIPNPNHIKEILTRAVIQLTHTCPQSALWLFHHPDVVEPEIRARDIIAQEVAQQLLAEGYIAKDFFITTNYRLEMTSTAKQVFFANSAEIIEKPILSLIQALLLSDNPDLNKRY